MNYLENNDHDFVMCDDKTGAMLNVAKRVDAVSTLQFLHEIHGILQKIEKPVVTSFEVHCVIRTLCVHFGWAPSDIAVVEHYAAVGYTTVGGSTPTMG